MGGRVCLQTSITRNSISDTSSPVKECSGPLSLQFLSPYSKNTLQKSRLGSRISALEAFSPLWK